ncbi:MAG: cell division protein FtsL [Thermodesulfobacteriota bacterium]|nr:cell division protein FtsL [Thermodesulfobacteriota bacterium]
MKKKGISRQALAGWLIIVLCLGTWGLFHVWTRSMAIEAGYALSRQQDIRERLFGDNNSLRLEISTLKSSRMLEMIAKNEFGMRMPDPEQMVYICRDE